MHVSEVDEAPGARPAARRERQRASRCRVRSSRGQALQHATCSGPRCCALAVAVLDGEPRYRALRDVLARELPRSRAFPPARDLQTTRARAAARARPRARREHLVVQGPPGSGKTCPGARLIVDLLARGNRVGDHGDEPQGDPQPARGGRAGGRVGRRRLPRRAQGERAAGLRASAHRRDRHGRATASCFDPPYALVAGTAWMFAAECADGQLDYLVIDEAGQLVARRRARRGHLRAQSHPARRPAAARAGLAGHPPRRRRPERARAPARRARDDPGRSRGLPRGDPADAPRRLRVHLRRGLRAAGSRSHPDCDRQARRRRAPASATCRSRTTATASTRRRRRSAIRDEIERLLAQPLPRHGRPRAPARARRLHGRDALQRAGARARGARCPPACASARSTSSRARRRRSSSSRWRPRAARMCRATSTSCSAATASTSPIAGRGASPIWSARRRCWRRGQDARADAARLHAVRAGRLRGRTSPGAAAA